MKSYIYPIVCCIFCFLLVPLLSFSQKLSGFVFEKAENGGKNPLPGVNIYWLGTTKGTFTDESGEFQIEQHGISNHKLVISLLGYRKDTVEVSGDKSRLKIELHPENRDLGEVEITGSKENSLISKLNPRQTQIINIGELQRAACCNLAESFETSASVDVSYSDAISGARQIQLLGLSGIYSSIMTENIPLICGLASTFGLNYIPGPWMESIHVSKGTASVMHGYESLTGQINVEYKKPENSEKFYANVFGNSNLRFEANLDGSIRINDKLSTMLFGHVDDFRYKFDRNDDGFMDLPKLTTFNVFNRWDYINPGKWVSKLGIKYLDENRNGGQMDFDKDSFAFDTTGISDGSKKYGIGIRTKRLEAFWKNGFFFRNNPQASMGLILSGISHEQNSFYGINKYYGHERSLFANLIFTTSFRQDMHKIAAGMSYLLDDYRENFLQNQLTYLYQVIPVPTTNPDTLFKLVGNNPVTFDMDRTEWSAGAYFEYTFEYKNKLTLIAGVRGDYDNLWGFFFTPRLHIRYKFNETTTLRASAGKGYRTANVLAENSPVFVSQRSLVFSEPLKQENAWNFGINFTKEFKLFRQRAEFEIDAYRTSFVSQVIADMDSLPTAVFFYNLDGRSFANTFQAQFIFAPVHRFTVTMAFRYNDVRQTVNGKLVEKAMVSSYKGLITLSYATKLEKWKFDLTCQLNGPARLPDTHKMPPSLQRPDYSKPWFQLLAQVTKKFKYVDIYVGGENLTNFTQKDPIVEYWKPYHTHFDASMIWGPVVGISVYAGIRVTVK